MKLFVMEIMTRPLNHMKIATSAEKNELNFVKKISFQNNVLVDIYLVSGSFPSCQGFRNDYGIRGLNVLGQDWMSAVSSIFCKLNLCRL